MIRLLVLALAALGALAAIRWVFAGGGSRSEFKCETCIHRRKLFHDGVLCGFCEKQVFKNPAQIEMCPDHTLR